MDVWSLGVSLSTMLTGALPFQAIGSSELNRKILRGAFILPEWLSAEAADLIHQVRVRVRVRVRVLGSPPRPPT